MPSQRLQNMQVIFGYDLIYILCVLDCREMRAGLPSETITRRGWDMMTSICRRELDIFFSKVESSGIPQYGYASRFIWKETRTFYLNHVFSAMSRGVQRHCSTQYSHVQSCSKVVHCKMLERESGLISRLPADMFWPTNKPDILKTFN